MTEVPAVLPAGYPDPTPYLLPEERLRLVVRRHHPIVLSGALAIVAVVAVVGLLVLLLGDPTQQAVLGVLAALGAALLYFVFRWVRWRQTLLVITNRRVFRFRSLGIKRVDVMPVLRQSIVFEQSPIGRRLGFGTVQVKTAGGGVLYNFDWLGNAERFRDEITDLAA
jgi:membrane protein YdbS with pleckstrin-like domain